MFWRKHKYALSVWKLKRLRMKALKAENTENHSLYQLCSRLTKGLKGMKGKVILKKGFALITIFAVIVTAYWQNNQTASAATWT